MLIVNLLLYFYLKHFLTDNATKTTVILSNKDLLVSQKTEKKPQHT